MNGTIDVVSIPRIGSRFTISLPISETPAQNSEPSPAIADHLKDS
jgi:hypothetical protein